MQVQTIEIEYGLTVNLGNYSNAKPIVRMTAELDEDNDPQSSLDELIDLAREREQAIADNELEWAGEQVKYIDGPLYQVMILNIIRTGALPDQQPTPTPDGDSSYPRGDEGVDDYEEDEDTDE